jgi:hypothetical protein
MKGRKREKGKREREGKGTHTFPLVHVWSPLWFPTPTPPPYPKKKEMEKKRERWRRKEKSGRIGKRNTPFSCLSLSLSAANINK